MENICLFDMDGTICDYDDAIKKDYDKLKSPNDPEYDLHIIDKTPYLKERIRLIRKEPGWWINLKKFELGFDIFNLAKELGFEINILTKSPRSSPNAWTEKVEWLKTNLSDYENINITISDDKGIVYGKVLVDDYPEYILRWLENRSRGLVIMPANLENKNFKHENVIRYDGTNLDAVKKALIIARDRQYHEVVKYTEYFFK